jgi:hypothetical protein
MSKNEDEKMGLQKEIDHHKLMSIFLKTKMYKDSNKFSIFDYHNEDKSILSELKSRRLLSTSYNESIIGLNKIKNIDNDKEYYFFFSFIDGLYYIKYDKDLFKKFNIRYNVKIKYRYDVNQPEFRDFIYIPISKMNKITNL